MSQMTSSLARMELLNLIESRGPLSPEQLAKLRKMLPIDLQLPLDQLRFIEMTLPLRKRKLFSGLQGDYLMVDENGRDVWASRWCHNAYKQTCPRMLKRR